MVHILGEPNNGKKPVEKFKFSNDIGGEIFKILLEFSKLYPKDVDQAIESYNALKAESENTDGK